MTVAEPKQPPGPVWGRSPWGYRLSSDGMRLEPYEPEQAALFVVRDLRVRGFKLREIAEELKKLGIVGRTGKPLGLTSIYYLLDEGEGSKRVVRQESRASDDDTLDDQPPESGFVERYPAGVARKGRREKSSGT
ncbi:MAG: hypothetical protein ACLP1X_05045 [Polyangiaceae bacterium]